LTTVAHCRSVLKQESAALRSGDPELSNLCDAALRCRRESDFWSASAAIVPRCRALRNAQTIPEAAHESVYRIMEAVRMMRDKGTAVQRLVQQVSDRESELAGLMPPPAVRAVSPGGKFEFLDRYKVKAKRAKQELAEAEPGLRAEISYLAREIKELEVALEALAQPSTEFVRLSAERERLLGRIAALNDPPSESRGDKSRGAANAGEGRPACV
jgi:hypothetical protein